MVMMTNGMAMLIFCGLSDNQLKKSRTDFKYRIRKPKSDKQKSTKKIF
jgi:hypothetical protein